MTITLLLLGCVIALTAAGFINLRRAEIENATLAAKVRDFHNNLVTYANSRGDDQNAFQRLTMASGAVERALGWDNMVNGVQVGFYLLNNAPLLPLALQEMRREYGSGSTWRDRGSEIADAVQTMIFRHLGHRRDRGELLARRRSSFGSCLAAGWLGLSAIPISTLRAFGILNSHRADAVRGSLLFRLWSLLLALAAISGPVIAYIADKEKVDAAISRLRL